VNGIPAELYWRRVRTASGSDRIIYHFPFVIFHFAFVIVGRLNDFLKARGLVSENGE
jgi:hypothetical protein